MIGMVYRNWWLKQRTWIFSRRGWMIEWKAILGKVLLVSIDSFLYCGVSLVLLLLRNLDKRLQNESLTNQFSELVPAWKIVSSFNNFLCFCIKRNKSFKFVCLYLLATAIDDTCTQCIPCHGHKGHV